LSERAVERLAGQKRDWEALAEIDPLWAILGDPSRRGGGWDIEEFFATAEATLAPIFTAAEELDVPVRWQRALDFGCGVGRITRALGSRFESACGIDISERMVELARELNADYPNCVFLLNDAPDLRQFEAGSFDLVFENLALQHLPSKALVWRYVSEFLRIVRPDGLVVFQLPSSVRWLYRLQLQRRVYALLRRFGLDDRLLQDRLHLTPIRMLTVEPGDAAKAIERARGRLVRIDRREDPKQPVRYIRYYVVAGAASTTS
jgi:SAM-dependent methyltransferase